MSRNNNEYITFQSHIIFLTMIYHYNIATVVRNITIKSTEDRKNNVSNIQNVNTILKIANQKTINKLVINPTLVENFLKRIESAAQQIIFSFLLKTLKFLKLFNSRGRQLNILIPILITPFLERSVLQNWTYKLCLCMAL
jgi:hypothetical protein